MKNENIKYENNMNEEYANKLYYQDTFDEVNAMSDLNSKVVQLADKKTVRVRKTKKLAVAVFTLAILITGTSVIAKTSNFSFFKFFSGQEESGYEMSILLEKTPLTTFEAINDEVRETVLKQQEEYEPWMSWYPLSFYKKFHSMNAALEYTGLDFIEHPLDGKKDFVSDNDVTLDILCNTEGKIKEATIESSYEINGSSVQVWYSLYSELKDDMTDEVGIGNGVLFDSGTIVSPQDNPDSNTILISSATPEFSTYQVVSGRLGSGAVVPVILSFYVDGVGIDCYFAKENVLYSVHVAAHTPAAQGDVDSAREIFDEVLSLY